MTFGIGGAQMHENQALRGVRGGSGNAKPPATMCRGFWSQANGELWLSRRVAFRQLFLRPARSHPLRLSGGRLEWPIREMLPALGSKPGRFRQQLW